MRLIAIILICCSCSATIPVGYQTIEKNDCEYEYLNIKTHGKRIDIYIANEECPDPHN